MKIRSITVFASPGYPPSRLLLQQVGIFANHAKAVLREEGYEVQSLRLATPPFTRFIAPIDLAAAAEAYAIEAHAEGFDYISLGSAPYWQTDMVDEVVASFSKSSRVFVTGQMVNAQGEISLPAVKRCAETIERLSTVEPGGFANLRFAALANVPPNCPFFPAAYADPGKTTLALAIEGADLALEAFKNAPSLEVAASNLVSLVDRHAAQIERVCYKLAVMYSYKFAGLDFTLAPFPEETASIGRALESLGVPAFGLHGSLFASALLTSTLDRASYTRTGFNGLMLPVLEDSGLAERASQGTLTVGDLLMYASVCGAGLDVIPLPGDTTAAQLFPLLLDLAALSSRLAKPLTARLMPIPGKQAGDMTEFSFGYFANSRVMNLAAQPLHGLLTGEETLAINPKYPKD